MLKTLKCKMCGKKFRRYVSRSYHDPKYCSRNCRNKARELVFGPSHPCYKTGIGRGYSRTFRKKVFSERKHECEVCRDSLTQHTFILMFKDKNPRNHNQDNVTLVCSTCFYKTARTKYKGLTKEQRRKAYQAKAVAKLKERNRIKKEGRKIPGWVESSRACALLHVGRERLRQLKRLRRIRIMLPPGYAGRAVYNLEDIFKHQRKQDGGVYVT